MTLERFLKIAAIPVVALLLICVCCICSGLWVNVVWSRPTTSVLVAANDRPASVGEGNIASFPLAGQGYFSNRNPAGNTDPAKDPYYAFWDDNGWLHQEYLPAKEDRVWHAVAFTIPEGRYEFNGSECFLYLDQERNGQGSQNPDVAHLGNSKPFVVNTKDGGEAWALVECGGGESTGFSIDWIH